ncbi:phage/plasmid primase, P4 family [Gordonia sp. NB41Y]|uniref:DNA primase family protein n=1 Tax=Gordonia sp. NB41Y TaxID=875808 RepID=UPI0003473ABE|nr:phage/plasmid primase, P4 family [Gordonia sp. NB41Y]WLP92979.1 phage/plasmid primase, P4 family [Gordonia sp. NB41Y]
MAYRLAELYSDRLLYVAGLGWHHWDGTRWQRDETGEAKRCVIAVLKSALSESLEDRTLRRDVTRCESATGIAGVLDIASALTPFACSVADLDADPYLLNTASGTVDLRTLTVSSHNPADRITKVTTAAYAPDAVASSWPRFIERVLPDAEVRMYLQRVAGVALLGRVVEHVLPILTGTGANGKGTMYKALLHALGDYGSTVEPDLFMHRQGAHPTGEMDLMGRRLVAVSESEKDRRLAEATMKRLTGGDTIRARRMRQDFVEFEPSHTPLLITNFLPKVSGDDPAIWRRIRVVPFDVVVPVAERDPQLDEKLAAEADAVLGWALAGYRAYVNGGGLNEPESVKVATDAYQRDSDAVARFVADVCVTSSPALKATTTQLHDAWTKWAVTDGSEPMSQKAFGVALDRLGYRAGSPSNGKRWRTGIAVMTDLDEEV